MPADDASSQRAGPFWVGPTRHTDLAGAPPGDFVRYVLVRMGFLRSFVNDDKVQTLFREWFSYDGVGASAQRLASCLQGLAKTLGVSRLDVFRALHEGRFAIPPELVKLPRVQRLVVDLDTRSEDYFDTVDKLFAEDRLIDSALAFLHELGIDWTWLVRGLIEWFQGTLDAYLAGGELVTTVMLTRPVPPAPDISLSFAPATGESAADAQKRLQDLVRETNRRFAEANATLGTFPKKTRETYEQYGGWLYRQAVQGKSIKAIAREEFGDDDRTSHIRYGLKRARALLALGDLVGVE